MHRPALLTAILVASLLALPPGSAQAAETVLLDDPAGDVQISANGSPATADPASAYSSADLRGLSLIEARTELTFTLTFEDLKSADEETAPEGTSTAVLFTHNGREFMLEVGRGVAQLATVYFSYLSFRDDAAADWSRVWSAFGEAVADADAETLAVSVPRDLLADADGAAPYPGRSLEAIRVESGSNFRGNPLVSGGGLPVVLFPLWTEDNMPDDGNGASYPLQLGVAQTGYARLSSEVPFRASNGEATTYILEAKAHNLAPEPDTFTFQVKGASNRLTVVVPVQALSLEADSTQTVPVLVTVPFGHDHGDSESFVLEMTSESDPGSVGRVEMGIRFLAVPQPAGHHDTLYFHSGAPMYGIGPVLQYQEGFFSTLAEDPTSAGGNHYSSGNGGFVGQWTYYFNYRLQPNLQIGLDFDLSRTGRLALPIGTTEPMLGTTVTGELYAFMPQDRSNTLIAVLDSGDPVDIDPQSQHLFEMEVRPEPDADRIPFAGDGMQLYLNFRVNTMTAAPTFGAAETGAYIAPGASMQLPLNEWHDDVDDVLASLSGPGLSPLGAQERPVNPGEAVIFHVSISNPLDTAMEMALEVSGPNAAWASLPSAKVQVPAHDTARASVVVRAPVDAVSGERADLVLQAYAKDDPATRGLLRFVTVVDTGQDHIDDSAAAEELAPKESPAPGFVLLLGLMVVLAISVRRRR